MSHQEEEYLRRAVLQPPSESLDARIAKLVSLQQAQCAASTPRRAARGWLVAAAACAACVLGGALAMGHWLRTAPGEPARVVEVRYVVQPEQKGFDVFDWTQYPKNAAPNSILSKHRAAVQAPDKT